MEAALRKEPAVLRLRTREVVPSFKGSKEEQVLRTPGQL